MWSYFVGAMTTPLFMLIPILTIWAGMFPIVVSKWAAGALTVYVLGQSAVLNFMHKRTHAFPIFFATVANNILWWTFIKACWKSLLSLIPGRAKITFKTTMKGAAGRLANSAIGDLWMPALSFVSLTVTLGIGISKLAHGPTVVTTLSISVVWIIYSMISPTLLLIYALGMRGRVLAAACKVCFLLSYVCSLLALMLLWAVYPAEYDSGRAAGASLRFYEAQRLGELPAGNRVAFRGNTFPYERSPKFRFDDLTGGWASGGAVGTVKMTVTTAFTTSMLAWGMLTFPRGYARAGETRHALDSVKWGADYLLKTFHPESGRKGGYTMVYQVGNLTTDFDTWATPENMTEREVRRKEREFFKSSFVGVERGKNAEESGLRRSDTHRAATLFCFLFLLLTSFSFSPLVLPSHLHKNSHPRRKQKNRCGAPPTSFTPPTAPRTSRASSSARWCPPRSSSASTATTAPTTTS